jgi:hypothetical protein
VGFTEPSGAGHAAVRNRTTKRYRDVAVAGRWYFPAPSLTLRVTALAFEVFRRRRAGTDPPLRKNRNRADPRVLAPLQSSHCCPGRTRPPLVGFVRRCVSKTAACAAAPTRAPTTPPPTPRRASAPRVFTDRASTPARVAACFGLEEPSSKSCSVLVVSHHLDGFLRSEVAGLLHPAAGHGVRRVSGSRIPDPRPGKPDRGGRTESFLATHFHTPRRHLDCSRTTSPWPLPPCRQRPVPLGSSPVHRCRRRTWSSTRPERRLRGFAPPSSPDTARPLPIVWCPVLPWALFPFEVLPTEQEHSSSSPMYR